MSIASAMSEVISAMRVMNSTNGRRAVGLNIFTVILLFKGRGVRGTLLAYEADVIQNQLHYLLQLIGCCESLS